MYVFRTRNKPTHIIVAGERFMVKPRYKLTTFILDLILACVTGGLWLLWPLFKFLRNGRR